ncbi:hypothetical protein H6F74_19345 [Trichocoleus sp. FACHB-90]|uniref:hypothetical protein n=1 Tax=Cyanophyceae TaxID=3028117 RepID=UPI00168366E6|nr:hypothetical protein [Trichocoleus sp. FACHB-90]MBD1831356.1 hypothetical protein [Cyanobacteria bacterium FACHB-472]MBD1928386.1 hypothetical protein [Trichocoleus sp. FACHB-90]
MFDIGTDVVNQKTGHIGKVIGYGHEMVNGVYSPTLKVLLSEALNPGKKGFIEEDLHSAWTQWEEAKNLSIK